MNGKYLIGAVIETVLKAIVIAVVVVAVFRGATAAYDFGYKVFADKPMSLTGGRTITVGVTADAKMTEIADMLEEKGLIEDSKLFVVQEFLSAYHDEILPGIYDLRTDMTAEQMLAVMSTPVEDEDLNQGNTDEDTQKEASQDTEESTDINDSGAGTEAGEDSSLENTEGMTSE